LKEEVLLKIKNRWICCFTVGKKKRRSVSLSTPRDFEAKKEAS